MSASTYVEQPPPRDLAGHVACSWRRRVGEDAALRAQRVLPDGCMDLMWISGRLLIAGPDTTAQYSQLPPGAEVTALRFRPGAAATLFGVPAAELLNARVDASDVLGCAAHDLILRLEAVRCSTAAAQLMQEAVRARLATQPELDRVVQEVVTAVRVTGGEPALRVAALAEQFAISERQLHRRCSAALGYGPKTFARIMRFQRFMVNARSAQPRSLSELAAHCGYADQAHLTREVRRLSDLSPTALVADLTR